MEAKDTAGDELLRLRAELDGARREIASLHEKLSAALDGTDLCLWQGDIPSGELTVFNLQQFASGDMAPNFEQWYAKLHPDDRASAVASYFSHLAGHTPYYEAEYRTLGPDGKLTWLWDRGRVVERDAAGRAVRIMGAHVDITARKLAAQRMEHLAHVDALTGLVNRRRMMDQLKQEWLRVQRHGGGFVLAMLDIDHFKRINDQYGHDAGDQVLVAVARAMEAALRGTDTCARWGGEEFLLLVPQAGLEHGLSVVGRVHDAVRTSRAEVDGSRLQVTASIGVAAHLPGESVTDMLRRADAALLRAKRCGRDCVLDRA
jgi:diguanylate cyclase (GGDEF)-like protein